jgi:hypothetical protein
VKHDEEMNAMSRITTLLYELWQLHCAVVAPRWNSDAD